MQNRTFITDFYKQVFGFILLTAVLFAVFTVEGQSQEAPQPPAKIADTDVTTTRFLCQALEKFATGKPDKTALSPDMRKFLASAKGRKMLSFLGKQGKIKSFELIEEAKFANVNLRGYRVVFQNSNARIGFGLDDKGKIDVFILRANENWILDNSPYAEREFFSSSPKATNIIAQRESLCRLN